MERYLRHRYDGACFPDDPEVIAIELIKNSDHEYLGKTPYGLKLVANDAQVWELLSNKPATFGATDEDPADIYRKWQMLREWFNATDLGKEINPKIGAVKVNRILESLGVIKRKDGGWVGSKESLRKKLVEKRDSANAYQNKPCVLLNRNLIPIIQDNVSK